MQFSEWNNKREKNCNAKGELLSGKMAHCIRQHSYHFAKYAVVRPCAYVYLYDADLTNSPYGLLITLAWLAGITNGSPTKYVPSFKFIRHFECTRFLIGDFHGENETHGQIAQWGVCMQCAVHCIMYILCIFSWIYHLNIYRVALLWFSNSFTVLAAQLAAAVHAASVTFCFAYTRTDVQTHSHGLWHRRHRCIALWFAKVTQTVLSVSLVLIDYMKNFNWNKVQHCQNHTRTQSIHWQIFIA